MISFLNLEIVSISPPAVAAAAGAVSQLLFVVVEVIGTFNCLTASKIDLGIHCLK